MTAISSELRKPEIRATILLAVVAFHGPLLLVLSSRQRRSGNPVGRFYLMVFFVPSQQLCMVSVSKKMFQMWYYRSIPHNLGRDFLLGTFALNIIRVISPDLIPRHMTYRACIQLLVLRATVEDAVIRTCMYLLDF